MSGRSAQADELLFCRTALQALASVDLSASASVTLSASARAALELEARIAVGIPTLPDIDFQAWIALDALSAATAELEAVFEACAVGEAGAEGDAFAHVGLPLSWGGPTLQAISILQQVTVPSGVSLDAALLDELRVSAGLVAGAMAGVSLDLAVVARISAGLSALVSLRMRLGIDPVQAGFVAVRARVAAVAAQAGVDLAAGDEELPDWAGLPGVRAALSASAAARLMCSFGVAPSALVLLPVNRTMCGKQVAANIMDHIPLTNILPFGMCTSIANPTVAAATTAALGVLTRMPCVPATVAPWVAGAPTVMLGKMPMLGATSTCMCMWAGVVLRLRGHGAHPGCLDRDAPGMGRGGREAAAFAGAAANSSCGYSVYHIRGWQRRPARLPAEDDVGATSCAQSRAARYQCGAARACHAGDQARDHGDGHLSAARRDPARRA